MSTGMLDGIDVGKHSFHLRERQDGVSHEVLADSFHFARQYAVQRNVVMKARAGACALQAPRNEVQKTFLALRRVREALLAAPEVWPGYAFSPAPPLSRH